MQEEAQKDRELIAKMMQLQRDQPNAYQERQTRKQQEQQLQHQPSQPSSQQKSSTTW